MPESNERQIEKLLKSAGARRREQAGTPEMHPATREMLQTEVRRQYGDAPLRKRGAFGMLLRWLPRLAVFVALGACAWLLWFRETTDASLQLARKQEVSEIPADEAVQLSSKPEGRAAREPLAVGGEWLPADEAAELQPATPASSPAPAAAPPQRSMSVRSQPADEGSKSVVGADFFKADRQAMYMGTAAAESEQKDHVAADTDGALGALMESNRAEARSATGPETSARKARPQTAVLQNFTIVNEGRGGAADRRGRIHL